MHLNFHQTFRENQNIIYPYDKMQNKYININYVLNFIISLVIILVAMRFASSYNHLSPNELINAISGKTGIHQSLSTPNRLYKMIFNTDNTFVMHTLEDCATVGTTTGYYKVISSYNNVGYIDITYTHVHDSPFTESMFNKNNGNNVHKTMKNLLGPFTLHPHANRASHILEYKCHYSAFKFFMTVYDN